MPAKLGEGTASPSAAFKSKLTTFLLLPTACLSERARGALSHRAETHSKRALPQRVAGADENIGAPVLVVRGRRRGGDEVDVREAAHETTEGAIGELVQTPELENALGKRSYQDR